MIDYTRSEGKWGVGFALMARFTDVNSDNIVQADVTSITYEVFAMSSPNSIATSTLNKAVVLFDTLQTDNEWPTVAYPLGYNFLWAVPGALVPDQGKRYRIIIDILLTDGEHLRHIHDHTTQSRLAA